MAATTLWNGAASSVWDLDGNWSGSKPASTDTAIMPDGNTVAVEGDNVTAYLLTEWTVRPGYSGTIGSRTAGAITNLQVDADTVNLAGSGVSYISLTGVTTCNVTGAAAGSPSTGSYGLTLSGATTATLKINLANGQSVGVAALAGQTGTFSAIDIDGDGEVVLGEGLTATALTVSGNGTVRVRCSIANITIGEGNPNIYLEKAAGVSAVLEARAGRVFNNSTGTIATTNMFPGSTVDCTGGPQARAMTTINNYGGIFDDSGQHTTWTTINRYCGDEFFKFGANWKQSARQAIA